MLLTLADCGKTTITIHGPPGTRQLLRSTTHFMRRCVSVVMVELHC